MRIGKTICGVLTAAMLAGLTACKADEPPRIPEFEYTEPVRGETASLTQRSYDYFSKIGSAGELSGTTLIISIFSNDAATSWDFGSKEDYSTYCWAYSDIGIAAE